MKYLNKDFWIDNDSIYFKLDFNKRDLNEILNGVSIGNNVYRHPLTPTYLLKALDTLKIDKKDYQNLIDQLYKEIDFIKEKWISEAFDSYLEPHQQQAVLWIRHKKTCGLFWEMRAGKTYPSCEATKDYDRIIVLTPAGQNDNWVNAYKLSGRNDIYTTKQLNKEKDRRGYYSYLNTLNSYVLIMNKETLTSDLVKYKDLVFRDLDYLIIDEAHYFKNNKSRLYEGALKLRKQAKHALALTGTPTPNGMKDILPLFSLLFYGKFSKTYIQEIYFNFEYNYYSDFGQPTDIKKSKEKDWIELLGLWFFQLKTQEVNLFSDDFKEQDILLTLPDKQKDMYEDMLFWNSYTDDSNEDVEEQNPLTTLLRLGQISTCPNILNSASPNIKEMWLQQFLMLNPNRKVIIFSQYTTYLKHLNKIFSNGGHNVIMITGETKNKVENAKAFNEGNINVLLGNIKAAGTGITLDNADVIVFLDRSWRPDENRQAMFRIMNTQRNKYGKQKYIYYLMIANKFDGMNSIDFYMKQINENKISSTKLVDELKEHINKYRNEHHKNYE